MGTCLWCWAWLELVARRRRASVLGRRCRAWSGCTSMTHSAGLRLPRRWRCLGVAVPTEEIDWCSKRCAASASSPPWCRRRGRDARTRVTRRSGQRDVLPAQAGRSATGSSEIASLVRWRETACLEPQCQPRRITDKWNIDEVRTTVQHSVQARASEEMQVTPAALWPVRPERQVLRCVGDEVVRLAICVVAMARPAPSADRRHEVGPNRVGIAVPHHLELVSTILDLGRPQALHDDLSAASDPQVVPSGETPIHELPERAECLLAAGGLAHDVWVGAHQAIRVDLDAELLLVLSEKCQELLSSRVAIEDEGVPVASPGAVID
jgi:hypothetical protein